MIQFDFLLYPKIPLPWWIGVGIGVFSLIVYMLLDRIAAGIHKQHDEHPKNITRLVTTGIYSKVRHPICLGAIQFNFGMLFLLRSLWSVIPAILLSFLIYFEAVQEEKYLTEMFGKEYEDYKKRVGMFFPKI